MTYKIGSKKPNFFIKVEIMKVISLLNEVGRMSPGKMLLDKSRLASCLLLKKATFITDTEFVVGVGGVEPGYFR